MNEMQLGNYRGRQHERIKVGLAHAASQLIEHRRQFDPGVDQQQKGVGLGVARFGQGFVGIGLKVQFDVAGAHAQAQGGVQGVHHVQVMRPGFRPVFPGVHAGVGADEVRLPVGGRACFIVVLQGLAVVGTLITEQRAAGVQPGAVGDQPVPVVMADLVAEMPEQGAVGFAKLGSAQAIARGGFALTSPAFSMASISRAARL